jgi:hypothetical protein
MTRSPVPRLRQQDIPLVGEVGIFYRRGCKSRILSLKSRITPTKRGNVVIGIESLLTCESFLLLVLLRPPVKWWLPLEFRGCCDLDKSLFPHSLALLSPGNTVFSSSSLPKDVCYFNNTPSQTLDLMYIYILISDNCLEQTSEWTDGRFDCQGFPNIQCLHHSSRAAW